MPDKPFQLNPKDFKTGNFILDKAVSEAVKTANKVDFNENGVPDISEVASLVFTLIPLLVALNECVDFDILFDRFKNNPAVKDRYVLSEVMKELKILAEKAGTLFPHSERP